MTTETTHQLAALQHIAAFSACVRGHELGQWQISESSALTSCVRCGAELRAHFPALQPEIDGAALERACYWQGAVGRAA